MSKASIASRLEQDRSLRAEMKDLMRRQYHRDGKMCEGKTKIIYKTNDGGYRIIDFKDKIGHGNGLKSDTLPGKGAWSNRTNGNVFSLLQDCNIHTSYVSGHDEIGFLSSECAMLPYEVVVRREAWGSFCKRHPECKEGYVFPSLLAEIFLKTSGKKWKGHTLVCDDPLLLDEANDPAKVGLHDPSKPMGKPFLVLDSTEIFSQKDEGNILQRMMAMAKRAFLILEKAWAMQRCTLMDFKVEFGIDPNGHLVIADDICNDNWRLRKEGRFICKESYRRNVPLDEVAKNYELVATLSEGFRPGHLRISDRPTVLLWCVQAPPDIKQGQEILHEAIRDAMSHRNEFVRLIIHEQKKKKDSEDEWRKGVQGFHAKSAGLTNAVAIVLAEGMDHNTFDCLMAHTNMPTIVIPKPSLWIGNESSMLSAPRVVSPAIFARNFREAAYAANLILAESDPYLWMLRRWSLESSVSMLEERNPIPRSGYPQYPRHFDHTFIERGFPGPIGG